MATKKILSIVCGLVLILAFQNCGRTVGFGTNGGSSGAMQSLVPLGDKNNVTTDSTTTSSTNPTDGDVVPPPTDPIPPTVCVADSDEDRDQEHHSCHSENHSGGASGAHTSHATLNINHEPEHDECSDDDRREDSEYVACIITDHGNSLKLGLLTTGLGGVNSVAESVCVTRSECLGDIAKSFNVRGAYERGYCEHNPNVKRLTDAEVKALLAN